MVSLLLDPVFDEIRSDDRFQAILKKIGLAKYLSQNQETIHGQREVLTIQSDTKEKLSLIADHLLYVEAEGNYSKFVWLEAGQIKEKVLRLKLSSTHQQIHLDSFVQIHRSYLANLNHFQTLERKGRQHYLSYKAYDLFLPVSRQKVKQFQ